jgi:hypothetical protein
VLGRVLENELRVTVKEAPLKRRRRTVASSSHFQGKEMYKYVFFLTSVVLRAGAGKFVTSPDSKPLQLLVLRRVFILFFS